MENKIDASNRTSTGDAAATLPSKGGEGATPTTETTDDDDVPATAAAPLMKEIEGRKKASQAVEKPLRIPLPPPPSSVDSWVTQQRAALMEEREEERQEVTAALAQFSPIECQDRGLSLLYLNITGTSTGLYGRTCISLGPSLALRRDGTLPAHGFGSGDEVVLRAMKGSSGSSSNTGDGQQQQQQQQQQQHQIVGVVTRTTANKVEVVASADDIDDDLLEGWTAGSAGSGHLRLDMLASEATHQKMMAALDQLLNYPNDGPATRLVNLCFGRTDISRLAPPKVGQPPSPSSLLSAALLNENQLAAVALGLATEDLALIHGPPGTGKTTAVVELILQAVRQKRWRLLVCAPSNVAVDNIVERIAAASSSGGGGKKGRAAAAGGSDGVRAAPRIVRMGHPARLSPRTLAYSLEALIEAADGTEIVQDIRRELSGMEKKKLPRDRNERRVWRGEIKALRKEIRVREEQVVKQILRSRDIVLCTNVGAATRVLREEVFDLVVIDEAAQALEASCWIPMLKAPRVVLAGDHKQLAPTIKSSKASKMGLGLTLFDRLMAQLLSGQAERACMLTVQYRMHARICGWASEAMYGGLLQPDPSVTGHTLADLQNKREEEEGSDDDEDEDDMTRAVLLLLDTAGCGMEEVEGERSPLPTNEDDGKEGKKNPKIRVKPRGLLTLSRSNQGEALVVEAHVRALLKKSKGLRPEDIAVITPYNAQVELLRSLLAADFPSLEIRSVDGFQGGEREAVVISLVRSNREREVGFLADDRRLNVAITRAKRHCCIVADSETVSVHPFLAQLMHYCEEKGELRSVMEYLPDWTGNAAGGGKGGGSGGAGAGKGKGKGKDTARAIAAAKKKGQEQRQQQQQQQQQAKKKEATTAASSNNASSNKGEKGRSSSSADGGEPDDSGSTSTGGSSSRRVHETGSLIPDNQLVAQVLQFCLSRATPLPTSLELPPELSGRQRKLVHDLVDGLKLVPPVIHESRGLGKKRRLVLERRPPPLSSEVETTGEDGVGEKKEKEKKDASSSSTNPEGEGEAGRKKDSRGGGGCLGDSGGGANLKPLKNNANLGSLHAERLGRQQQQQQQQQQSHQQEQQQQQQEHRSKGGQAAASRPAAKAESKSCKGESDEAMTAAEQEALEMEAINEAIRVNANLTELPHGPPSEATKARLYGWDRNPKRKDIAKNLKAKLVESAEKRQSTQKKDEGKKRGGGGGGGSRR